MAVSILLADDDELLRNLVKEILEDEDFMVYEASDGEQALDLFFSHPELSLVVLDIMMPKLGGLEVLREVRERSDLPVLMLTALGDSSSELSGLKLGANDYVSKPFHNEILVERVKNLLKLTKAPELDRIRYGILEIDHAAHRVYVEGSEVTLNNKEYHLLEYLVLNQNIVLTREKILDRIWGYEYEGEIRTIDTHVKMLRAVLGEAGNYIKTVRGTGYSFEVTE